MERKCATPTQRKASSIRAAGVVQPSCYAWESYYEVTRALACPVPRPPLPQLTANLNATAISIAIQIY